MKKLKIFILVSSVTFFLVLIVKAFENPTQSPPSGGGALQIQSNQLLITKPTKVTGTNTFIVEGGNVGIGTTNPTMKLHVVGGVGGNIRIDSGDNNVLYIGHDSDVGDWIQFRPENALGLAFLRGPDAPAMVVTNEGNVGIGTMAPQSKLHVVGNAVITGNVGIGTTAPNNLIQVKDLINFNNTNFGTFLGYQAGKNILSDGFENTALGYQALYTATSSDYNIAIGNYALFSNTTGYNNTAIGYKALYYNTTGSSNTALGYLALYSNTEGSYNTALGLRALFSNTTGNANTALGYLALYSNTTGSYNTAIGLQALFSNTTSSYNTAIGYEALYYNTQGSYNTALGYRALFSNTTGDYNTALGYQALYNTQGYYNTAIGHQALFSNTTGGNNTAIGSGALYSNTTGYYNTAIGSGALRSNTTGEDNTAIGLGALRSNTTGDDNTAIGAWALYYNTTGIGNVALGHAAGAPPDGRVNTTENYNTFIGYGSGLARTGITNATAIGKNAKVGCSNCLVLGGTGDDAVKVGIGTTEPTERLDVVGNVIADGYLYHSDIRFKQNILPLNSSGSILEKLNNLQGVYFKWNDVYKNLGRGDNKRHIGLIAQEVEKEFPELVSRGNDGSEYLSVDYSRFTAVLLEGLKELNQKLEELKNKKEIQLIDKSTNEIYCVWLENGEFQKSKGECK